jgi:hypothetical protein
MIKNTDWKAKWEVDLVIEFGQADPAALGNYVLADISENTSGERRKLSLKRISEKIRKDQPHFFWESYARACEQSGIKFSKGMSATQVRLAKQAQEIATLKAKLEQLIEKGATE